MQKVNLAEKFALFSDHWSPKIVGELNSSYVKLAKFSGKFIWHKHDNEDELFLAIQGRLKIKLRENEIDLGPGVSAIIPKGIEHLPIAHEQAHVLLLEPKATLNTGNVRNKSTLDRLEWI